MNWDAISAISEVVGVVLVLASILYLARQVAQANKLNEADSVRNFLAEYNTVMLQIGEDEELMDIFQRGAIDFDSLSHNEKGRLHMVLWSHFMLGQSQRMNDPSGNEELSKFADYMVASTANQPGFSEWWRVFKTGIPDQEYVRRIDDYEFTSEKMWEEWIPWLIANTKEESPPNKRL